MQKRSGEYWKKRFLNIEAASNAYGQDAFRQIEPAFDSALTSIQKEINSWYGRYAKNNKITIEEAKRQLSTKELKEFKWDVKEYIRYGKENAVDQSWMRELENASARVHVNRLEALKVRTQQAAEVAFGNELDGIDAMARKVYTEDYYHSIFEMQRGFNIGWEIGQIDERKLEKLITKPWAADGKNFSDRIWEQKTQLVNELHSQLTRTCILGKAPDEAINAISKKFGVTKNQAGRLVMTEQAYFHSVAQQEAFKELDVEEFEVVATLDSHTSDICQEMDGKHFPMKDYQPGVTAPPFHVWCRSVTVPWFEDNFTGERAARDVDGKTYYVPDSMTYEDWKKSMVEGQTDGLTEIADDLTKHPGKLLTNASKSDIISSKWDNGLPPRGQVTEKIPEDQLYSFVANELHISEDEAIGYVDSVMAFTDAGSDIYSEIRRYQRGDKLQFLSQEEVKELSDGVETYIQKAPRWNGGTTFRGASVSDDELASYIQGTPIQMGGTASWSGTQSIARDFAERNTSFERPNSVIYHCETQSKGTGIKHISVFEHEDEILCSKESGYIVERIEVDDDHITHVFLREDENL